MGSENILFGSGCLRTLVLRLREALVVDLRSGRDSDSLPVSLRATLSSGRDDSATAVRETSSAGETTSASTFVTS